MNKFEKLIEYIINDEDQKARELFHDIVVEKSRDIYESIMDEEGMEEAVHGSQVEDMVDEIGHEESVGEAEEEEEEEGFDLDHEEDDELGGEMPASDEEHEEHEEIEDKVMDIDAKLDELLAKFDEIMGHEGGEEMPAMHDEEPAMDEMGMMESADEEEEEEEEESKEPKAKKTEESRSNRSSSELMREYVDRIGDIYGGQGDANEGDAVGAAGKKISVNTKSEVGPGADFGGKHVDFEGAEEAVDGKPINKPNNEYSKGEGRLIGKVGNTPGGDKKLKAEPAGHGAEKNGDTETGKKVGSTSEKASINKKSEIGGKVR